MRANFRPVSVTVISSVRGMELVELAPDDRPRPIRPVARPQAPRPAQPVANVGPVHKHVAQVSSGSPTKQKPEISKPAQTTAVAAAAVAAPAAAHPHRDAAPAEKRDR